MFSAKMFWFCIAARQYLAVYTVSMCMICIVCTSVNSDPVEQ